MTNFDWPSHISINKIVLQQQKKKADNHLSIPIVLYKFIQKKKKINKQKIQT